GQREIKRIADDDSLSTLQIQDQTTRENMYPLITEPKRKFGRQYGQSIAAGETHGTCVGGCDVSVWIQRGNRKVGRLFLRDAGRHVNSELAGTSRNHHIAWLDRNQPIESDIGNTYRLDAGGPQTEIEGMAAGIGTGERVIGGKHSLRVCA